MPDDCLVCNKHRGDPPAIGGAIHEDNLFYASHVFIPDRQDAVYLGWLVLEPKRHAPGLADLTDEEAQHFGLTASRLSRALIDATGAEWVYAFVLGHHVPHLHLHLLPRYANTPREYWWPRIDEWPDAPRGGVDDIANVAERVRTALAKEVPA